MAAGQNSRSDLTHIRPGGPCRVTHITFLLVAGGRRQAGRRAGSLAGRMVHGVPGGPGRVPGGGSIRGG
jgi:hypothetical protein